ncbi:hypothetical protein PFISCL1PPCAC_1638, partial [Pristionchus fissidentatus]
ERLCLLSKKEDRSENNNTETSDDWDIELMDTNTSRETHFGNEKIRGVDDEMKISPRNSTSNTTKDL